MNTRDVEMLAVAGRRLLEGLDDGKDEGPILDRRSDLRTALRRLGYEPRPLSERDTDGWAEPVPLELAELHRCNSQGTGAAEIAALRAERDIYREALRKIDEDIIGLHRFNADGLCSLCNNGYNGSSEPFCEACVAHNALEDATKVTRT